MWRVERNENGRAAKVNFLNAGASPCCAFGATRLNHPLRRADHLRANLRRLYLSRLSYGTALVSEKAVSLTPAIAFMVFALIVPRRVRYTSIPSITRWT